MIDFGMKSGIHTCCPVKIIIIRRVNPGSQPSSQKFATLGSYIYDAVAFIIYLLHSNENFCDKTPWCNVSTSDYKSNILAWMFESYRG